MTVVDTQLGVNGAKMISYRARRKVKRLGDLGVGEAAFGQAQDLNPRLGQSYLLSHGAGQVGHAALVAGSKGVPEFQS